MPFSPTTNGSKNALTHAHSTFATYALFCAYKIDVLAAWISIRDTIKFHFLLCWLRLSSVEGGCSEKKIKKKPDGTDGGCFGPHRIGKYLLNTRLSLMTFPTRCSALRFSFWMSDTFQKCCVITKISPPPLKCHPC